MLTTDKFSCNILADLLVAHGVKDIVISPGSRNAPLILALSRREEFRKSVVIDERSAAFIALGMSLQSGRPTAVVCTSGTALLNYAPAVAEAYYRGVPLIVVSADRPEEWIDQDDSQTIWQQNALASIVKRSCDIGAHLGHSNGRWICNRLINDSLLEAVNGRKGPVHINIRLDAPLNMTGEALPSTSRIIGMAKPEMELSASDVRSICSKLKSTGKVLIIAGFHEPDRKLNDALTMLADLPNVAVMTETIANLHSESFISRIDTTLSRMSETDRMHLAPDIVVTIGGALVSRHVKDWLRKLCHVEHWHVGVTHTTIDCFKHLTLRIEVPPANFMYQVASMLRVDNLHSDYALRWRKAYLNAVEYHDRYISACPWSDMKAFSMIIPKIPSCWNLHLSNGTPIRYAQLMDCSHINRCDCNRGVSGIDGCTSTALGASVVYDNTTLLITGDMSCQYDLAALSSKLISSRFKMIVMCNGGGAIFRFISSTSSLPELEEYFAVGTTLPLKQISEGYGFSYFEAHSAEGLDVALKGFIEETSTPAILAIFTPPETSAEVLKRYFAPA